MLACRVSAANERRSNFFLKLRNGIVCVSRTRLREQRETPSVQFACATYILNGLKRQSEMPTGEGGGGGCAPNVETAFEAEAQ